MRSSDNGTYRNRPAFYLVGVLLLVVSACGGDDAETTTTESEDAATSTEAPEEVTTTEGDTTTTTEAMALPFEGETIALVVGYDPGGSYDTAARWIQPYLEAETGATVVVENMPGAGNLIALNHIWTSEPDGTTIGTMNGPGTAVAVLTDTAGEAIEFDLGGFSYLAGLTSEPRLLTVGADSPYETFDDMLASEETIVFGVTGTSGAGYNDAVFMQAAFGDQLDIQIVSGFESGAETSLALVRGEVDVAGGLLGGELAAIEAGEVRPILVLSEERSDALPDVPTITEFDLSPEAAELVDVHITIAQLGIILTAPPDMPADLLDPLREAVMAAATVPELVAEAESQGVAWVPRSAEEIEEVMLSALDAPQAYIDLMVEAQSAE